MDSKVLEHRPYLRRVAFLLPGCCVSCSYTYQKELTRHRLHSKARYGVLSFASAISFST